MRHTKFPLAFAVSLMASLVLAACAGPAATAPTQAPVATVAPTQAAAPTTAPTTAPAAAATAPSSGANVDLRYSLWDSSQQPAYQACADAFHQANPNITIKIEQAGWNDYWDGLTASMVAGTAPDVFTDHLAKYPELLSKGQLLDIQPFVTADNVDTKMYLVDANLWVKDGKRYGLPKDWDTIAVYYNAAMLKTAGIDPASLKGWTWNPTDGGTFEQTIAKLTLDNKGRNGLDPNFDKTNVVQWGFTGAGPGDGSSGAQTDWSSFAASTGFQLTDGPWATAYHYDDPRLAQTVQWWADLHLVKGYAPGSDALSGGDNKTLFFAGKAAMTTDGSWQINNFAQNSKAGFGIAELPAGPVGVRSPINGLSDAIWTGTKHPNEAWQWVKFLASPACANIVGTFGVVFPAIQSGVDKSLAAHQKAGVDASAFTTEAATSGVTYLLPITDHGSDITNLANPVLQDIFDGKAKAADALPKLNSDINALFK